jgi:hypothetical protein
MAVPDRSLGQVRQRVHHAAERTMGKAPNVFAAVWQASMGPSAFHRTLRSVFFIAGTLWHRSALLQLPPILATLAFDRFTRLFAAPACSVINGFIKQQMKTIRSQSSDNTAAFLIRFTIRLSFGRLAC